MQTGSKPPEPDDASDPEARWWWRVGHATPWLLAAAWAIITVAFVFDWRLIGFAVSLAFPVLFVTYIRHDFQPVCIRCLREQPEDGGMVAQRKLRQLWAYHLPGLGPVGRSLGVIAACGLWVAGSIMRESNSPLGIVLGFLGGSVITYDWYLTFVHRRLKPWCPWCRDPGGDPDQVPERDPDPSMTKQS
jgi:hypothetical protein